MKVDIGKYLKINRDKLDIDQPEDDRIWEGIRNDLHKKKQFLPHKYLRIAAFAMIFISIGFLIQQKYKQSRLERANLYTISKLLGKQEQEYINNVSAYLRTIEKLPAKSDEIISDLLLELNALDTIYDEAFCDLNKFGYKEQIVNIIFDTYEKKIRILEKIIVESQKIEENEKKEYKVIL